LRKLFAGLIAMAFAFGAVPIAAQAGSGTVTYKPGVVKAAIAKGKTVLLHYKSTW
jgi:hypothetical protein